MNFHTEDKGHIVWHDSVFGSCFGTASISQEVRLTLLLSIVCYTHHAEPCMLLKILWLLFILADLDDGVGSVAV